MASLTDAEIQALAHEVRALRSEVAFLRDRQAIHDTLNRYTHAVDRHDWEMLYNEVYHPDGIADHGHVVGPAQEIVAYLEPRYINDYLAHSHFIGNHLCEIDGDTAHTETYVITYGVMKDGSGLRSSHARYIDRLEKRDGKWKIALRRIVSDARTRVETVGEQNPASTYDKTDLSYQRPLTLPAESAAKIKKK